jgi:hypothetical protein
MIESRASCAPRRGATRQRAFHVTGTDALAAVSFDLPSMRRACRADEGLDQPIAERLRGVR